MMFLLCFERNSEDNGNLVIDFSYLLVKECSHHFVLEGQIKKSEWQLYR